MEWQTSLGSLRVTRYTLCWGRASLWIGKRPRLPWPAGTRSHQLAELSLAGTALTSTQYSHQRNALTRRSLSLYKGRHYHASFSNPISTSPNLSAIYRYIIVANIPLASRLRPMCQTAFTTLLPHRAAISPRSLTSSQSSNQAKPLTSRKGSHHIILSSSQNTIWSSICCFRGPKTQYGISNRKSVFAFVLH